VLQRGRVPSTRQEAVASSCPKTRVLVSYWLVLWLPGARGSIQSRDPLLVRTDRPGHPARVCRGKAEKRRRHRQRLLGRHVAVPAARGVAAGRRDSYPHGPHGHTHAHTHISRAGQPSRQAFAFGAVGQRRGSRIRAAAGACEIYRCSCCRPAACV
jgi:hypothetical protein